MLLAPEAQDVVMSQHAHQAGCHDDGGERAKRHDTGK